MEGDFGKEMDIDFCTQNFVLAKMSLFAVLHEGCRRKKHFIREADILLLPDTKIEAIQMTGCKMAPVEIIWLIIKTKVFHW